jgi:hypothetical protein
MLCSQQEEVISRPQPAIRDPPVAVSKGRPRTARLTGPTEGPPRGGGAKRGRGRGRSSRGNPVRTAVAAPGASTNTAATLTTATASSSRKRKRNELEEDVVIVESRPGKRQVKCSHCGGLHGGANCPNVFR